MEALYGRNPDIDEIVHPQQYKDTRVERKRNYPDDYADDKRLDP